MTLIFVQVSYNSVLHLIFRIIFLVSASLPQHALVIYGVAQHPSYYCNEFGTLKVNFVTFVIYF